MTEGDTLVKALADVRQRKAELQSEFDRISTELAKLKLAEKALAAIVEGTPLDAGGLLSDADDGQTRAQRGTTRGVRGPRANSAKGRLRALLHETGPQGLSQADIARQLPDVAEGTLNAYLSVMVTRGEAVRRGDFYTAEGVRPDDEKVEDVGSTDGTIRHQQAERDEAAE
ncbi:hypothetical protein [Methylobacterium trifolii]|uniref:Uncharacterized protein n=1 Tax=Methylobacterium trifolii TaxID=1003092 RepID=A0ABQ4TZ41_9HYPH|nr:hypothetical protein [Methylobacterium trifolii]GJE60003.1 hypothetical protein MPOCJGCO_2112 [Methylobacterium trifolii]